MLKNYLAVAIRNLRRRKGHSFINIAGLTVGLACCLLIFQHVSFEYSFDRFHENEPELYRAVVSMARVGDEILTGSTYTPLALGPALLAEVPEVERFARVHIMFSPALVTIGGETDRVFEEETGLYVDPAFLDMFTFPLLEGDRREALQPWTALISESLASRYFGDASPVGEVLDIAGQITGSYRITGVFRDVPANSHLQFEMLLPIEEVIREGQYAEEPDGWWSNNFITYLQLRRDASPATANLKMTEMLLAHRGDALAEQGWQARLFAQPLREVYLDADVQAFATRAGSYRSVYFFTIIGLVTLLIALVNYVNLATARALDRAREVGVRKAIGAQRLQLVGQFMSESALTIGAAALLAVAVAAASMPIVNNLAETQLSSDLWQNPGFWAAFLSTLVVATLLAGLYPAFVLSAFQPVAVLKGKVGSLGAQLWLRRGLVVLQFGAAVVLIGGTAVVYHQLQFMRSMDLGLDLEQVITVPGPRIVAEGTTPTQARLTFAEELRRQPGVRQVASSWALPGQGFNWHGANAWRAEQEEAASIRGMVTYVDTSFASLYGLEVVVGSPFDDRHALWGGAAPWAVLANETAVRSLGFASPAEALDHPILIAGNEVRIVGVLRDFNWSSAHEERENIFMGRTTAGGHYSIRVAAAELPVTIAAIEAAYLGMFPGNVFRYSFADEAFGTAYREDQRFATLFSLFAGLAIAIACLGLFGLAAFTAQQRRREIGVRKVLGASVAGLVALLSRDFLKLVVVAVVIGSPVVYLLMSRWLEGFAYRVEIGPGVFLLVGLLTVLIALLTVSYQSIRAAMADPVKAIRSE
jgi:putative ABC transport system permease protein